MRVNQQSFRKNNGKYDFPGSLEIALGRCLKGHNTRNGCLTWNLNVFKVSENLAKVRENLLSDVSHLNKWSN